MSAAPVLCLVTDRSRWRAAPDGEPEPDAFALQRVVPAVRAAALAGVHLVQIRERDLDGGPLVALVSACVAAVRDTFTRIVVNDRLDVALAAGAHGVHLRGDSMSGRRVRTMVPPGFLVGRSVHDPHEAEVCGREGSLDYLIFGTVWPTASKAGRAPAGGEALQAAAAATTVPVLAIGGVSEAHVPDVARAGASGVAAIGLFSPGGVGNGSIAPDDTLAARVARIRRAWAAAGRPGDR